ncbi:hypothetical protein JTE90_000954 [Oedothorax gibbosus]|uniref:Uncharacterized protein n=1 Tax=Oedothorax gibbosus TaxID=931172 RepID=A0AAV6TEZ1_9ARAC|nr:hypothetical protein JTE90_000954 [Oedothorax gibbosus]
MSSRSDCIFPRPVDIVAALDSSKDYWIAHLLQVMAYVSHITGDGDRIYHKPLDQNTFIKGKGLEHLKFCLHEVLGQVPFDSRQLDRTWDSIGRRLRRDPSRSLSNSNVCLLFKLHNMFSGQEGLHFRQLVGGRGRAARHPDVQCGHALLRAAQEFHDSCPGKDEAPFAGELSSVLRPIRSPSTRHLPRSPKHPIRVGSRPKDHLCFGRHLFGLSFPRSHSIRCLQTLLHAAGGIQRATSDTLPISRTTALDDDAATTSKET